MFLLRKECRIIHPSGTNYFSSAFIHSFTFFPVESLCMPMPCDCQPLNADWLQCDPLWSTENSTWLILQNVSPGHPFIFLFPQRGWSATVQQTTCCVVPENRLWKRMEICNKSGERQESCDPWTKTMERLMKNGWWLESPGKIESGEGQICYMCLHRFYLRIQICNCCVFVQPHFICATTRSHLFHI